MTMIGDIAKLPASLADAAPAHPQVSVATAGDYAALLKPRVMSLVVFTALVGLVAAPGAIHPVLAFTALLCIAVGAGASGALNMWYDADIDALMSRTASRPIPRHRLKGGRSCKSRGPWKGPGAGENPALMHLPRLAQRGRAVNHADARNRSL